MPLFVQRCQATRRASAGFVAFLLVYFAVFTSLHHADPGCHGQVFAATSVDSAAGFAAFDTAEPERAEVDCVVCALQAQPISSVVVTPLPVSPVCVARISPPARPADDLTSLLFLAHYAPRAPPTA